jgi:hypothetical protein
MACALAVAGLVVIFTMISGSSAGQGITLAVDVNTAGNDDDQIGSIESCVSVSEGATDIIIDLVATGISDAQRIKGAQVDIDYDESIVEVDSIVALDAPGSTAPDDIIMITRIATTGGFSFDLSADATNTLTVAASDGSADPAPPDNHESGDGVIGRITMHATGTGTTDLTIGGPLGGSDTLVDTALVGGNGAFTNQALPIETMLHAQIAVGENCPATPTPPPTEGPIERLHGDMNCSGNLDLDDAEPLLPLAAGLPADIQSDDPLCPELGASATLQGFGIFPWGDLNCDGVIDGHDVLIGLLVSLGLDTPAAVNCPEPGDQVVVDA